MNSENINMDKFEELCAGYVLNALTMEERDEFERMLSHASEERRKLFLDLQAAASQLMFTMERGEPADKVKKRLLERIRSGNRTNESAGALAEPDASGEEKDGDSTTYFAIAASFALLIISLSLLFYAFNLSRQMKEKEQTIENQQAQITSLQNEVQQKEELLTVLGSREVNMVLLTGMEASPGGYGKIIWDPESNRALLQVSNLPAVPSDKDYQLWILKENQPVSAGVFSVRDSGKDTFFKIEEMDSMDDQSANAFAVTLEPKGGMPQPTGDMYLMGKMNSQ